MFNDLFKFVLSQLEISPSATFRESELVKISKRFFDSLEKGKYLLFDHYDKENQAYVSDRMGDEDCERFISKRNGKIFAHAVDPSVPTIELSKDEITYYRFSHERLIQEIREVNQLTAQHDPTSNLRLQYVGKQKESDTAVLIGYFENETQAEAELASVWTRISKHDLALILCPSIIPVSQQFLNSLMAQNIICVPFKDAFKKKNFALDFSVLAVKRDIPADIKLSPQQKEDYVKYGYLCYDSIEIPGTIPSKRSNDLIVNGHKIKMPDEGFKFLLELVVELKKGQGGWLTIHTERGKYQKFDNLRTRLEGSLRGKDAKKFIENDSSEWYRYRISTHPDFVTYDRDNLLKHGEPTVPRKFWRR